MRLPLDKPYRAFPELDRFSDEECCRFVAAARRHHRPSGVFVYGLMIVAAGLMCPLTGLFQAGLSSAVGVFGRPSDELSMAVFGVSIAFGTASASLGWLVIRDRWLRRVIRDQLKGARCYGCGYSLLGLPIAGDGIICPECGQRFDLREADLTPEDLLAQAAVAARNA